MKPETTNLLVVDDSPTIRSYLAEVLSHAGFTVQTASRSQPVTAADRSSSTVTILLDLVGVTMEGREMLRALCELDSQVIVTGTAASYHGCPALQLRMTSLLGAQAALAQPSTAGQILHQVRQQLLPATAAPRASGPCQLAI
jgi:DNA-binding response OmpR family regulator